MDTKKTKSHSYIMGSLDLETRNLALKEIGKALALNKEEIFLANSLDIEKARSENIEAPLINRLKFDEKKLNDCLSGINDLVSMEDPLFKVDFQREIKEGLTLLKESCPIGVIGVIFESRPDALVQISSLCIKSGNCVILKGGKEALLTNKALFGIIKAVGIKAGLPENFITLLETREGMNEILKCEDDIDLIIPRGSNSFVRYIMDNTKIPVMGHADGICHIYIHSDANIKKALDIVMNSKTNYVSACNAVETLLVNKRIASHFLEELKKEAEGKVKLIIDEKNTNYKTEYGDYVLAVKTVDNIDEAISHINTFGSHHTDCIITENEQDAKKFMRLVDSAGVYQNASTRFADGYRYGFGAEVGISTGKLHARGPVGIQGLVTYKYKLFGNGHIVS